MKRRLFVLLVPALAVAGCNRAPVLPKGTIAPFDVAAPPSDATVTSTGLAYRVLATGPGGRHPGPDARVVVNYTGWTTDGTIIEGEPADSPPVTIVLNQAMPGWREGLHMMSVGDKWRFWIPEHLAFNGAPGKPPGMVVYDISLVQFVD